MDVLIRSARIDDAPRILALIEGGALDALLTAARERGCYRVQLTSNKQRGDAHRFYERNGFSATHEGFKRYLAG